jgi:Cys-tRNA(Pro) deacylase
VNPYVARVSEAAAARGLELDLHQFPEGTHTADEAARAIGVEVAQIVKSLVFVVDGAPVMALVAGHNRLDERRLSAALGGATVRRADAALVKEATGYSIGGVPPFGHASELATVVDEDLLAFDVVWAAAGTAQDVFPLSPDDLVRVSGGTVAPLRKEPTAD